ncbi:MAG: hypothetical protein DRP85_07620 [Candidatus Makaraimicrobium thalassicum]|nr:MAG: hypothetical protein DRP85_07620 [Candidatus Omnitrophota bacterium]
MKKVSVVIPAYNRAGLTVRTVESVLNQTYENIEIIVVDDGSTDDTRERLRPYAGRIRYVYKRNGGASSARNLGIRLATGDYIGLLDCDDIYLPGKIEKSVNYLEERPDTGFVHTPIYLIDEEDTVLRSVSFFESRRTGWISRRLLLRNFIANSTVVARRSCFEKAGLFDETIFNPADWDMWLRLAGRCRAGYVNVPLTLYRTAESYTLSHLEQSEREDLIVLEKAFRRNPELSPRFKNRLVSNVYCRHAVCYLSIKDFDKARQKLILSIRKHMFNTGALLLLAAVTLLRGNFYSLIKWRRKFFAMKSRLLVRL